MILFILILTFILGFLSNRTEEHLKPTEVFNPILFNIGKLISYTICGVILGLLGFLIKINGFNGGILLFIFAFAVLIVTLSFIPIFPKLVIVGLRSHHHPKHSFFAGLLNIFASSASLHITMIIALAHGYYFESGLVLLTFAIGTLYIPGKKLFNFIALFNTLKVVLFFIALLFISNKALLYSELYNFSTLEYKKTAIIPESLNNIQFLRTETDQFNDRIVMSNREPLSWMIQGLSETDRIYIPRYRHKSILGMNSETLNIQSEKPGFIYFTGHLGQGDYIIKVLDQTIDAYNLPYKVVLDSGYKFGIHEAEMPVPDINLTTEPGIAIESDGKQYVDINVTESGYEPTVIVLKKGIPAVVNFYVTTLTEDNKRIIMPSYNEYLEFILGSNPINVPDPLIDFIYYNWKGGYGGYILVVDNPDEMTKEKAIRQIRMFNVNGI